MAWYVNGLTKLIASYIKFSSFQETQIRMRLEKLFALTLRSPIGERSYPITAACNLFRLVEKQLIYMRDHLPKHQHNIPHILNFIAGSMIVTLKFDCDYSYHISDFLLPINSALQSRTTLSALKSLEMHVLEAVQFNLTPKSADEMIAIALKHCDEGDILDFWHDLNNPDYADSHEYIEAAIPFIKQAYRNKFRFVLSAATSVLDTTQTDKIIFNYISSFCDTIKIQKDYSLIQEVLSEEIFDFLRKRPAKTHYFFFITSYPTLWENILSLIKEKAAVKTAAQIIKSYQRCMARPLIGL